MIEYRRVNAEWHTFYIGGVTFTGDLSPVATLFVESVENDAAEIGIRTGVAMGPVLTAVEVRHDSPGADLTNWEDIAETSVRVSEPLTVFGIWDEELAHSVDIAPGDYRLRVSASGREIEYDAAAIEPIEHYLLQLWPAASSPTTFLRSTTHDLRH